MWCGSMSRDELASIRRRTTMKHLDIEQHLMNNNETFSRHTTSRWSHDRTIKEFVLGSKVLTTLTQIKCSLKKTFARHEQQSCSSNNDSKKTYLLNQLGQHLLNCLVGCAVRWRACETEERPIGEVNSAMLNIPSNKKLLMSVRCAPRRASSRYLSDAGQSQAQRGEQKWRNMLGHSNRHLVQR